MSPLTESLSTAFLETDGVSSFFFGGAGLPFLDAVSLVAPLGTLGTAFLVDLVSGLVIFFSFTDLTSVFIFLGWIIPVSILRDLVLDWISLPPKFGGARFYRIV